MQRSATGLGHRYPNHLLTEAYPRPLRHRAGSIGSTPPLSTVGRTPRTGTDRLVGMSRASCFQGADSTGAGATPAYGALPLPLRCRADLRPRHSCRGTGGVKRPPTWAAWRGGLRCRAPAYGALVASSSGFEGPSPPWTVPRRLCRISPRMGVVKAVGHAGGRGAACPTCSGTVRRGRVSRNGRNGACRPAGPSPPRRPRRRWRRRRGVPRRRASPRSGP